MRIMKARFSSIKDEKVYRVNVNDLKKVMQQITWQVFDEVFTAPAKMALAVGQ